MKGWVLIGVHGGPLVPLSPVCRVICAFVFVCGEHGEDKSFQDILVQWCLSAPYADRKVRKVNGPAGSEVSLCPHIHTEVNILPGWCLSCSTSIVYENTDLQAQTDKRWITLSILLIAVCFQMPSSHLNVSVVLTVLCLMPIKTTADSAVCSQSAKESRSVSPSTGSDGLLPKVGFRKRHKDGGEHKMLLRDCDKGH